jgi:hypothetical protein
MNFNTLEMKDYGAYVTSATTKARDHSTNSGEFTGYNYGRMSKERADKKRALQRYSIGNFKTDNEADNESSYYEKLKGQLLQKFQELDKDGNEVIDGKEMMDYFIAKGYEEQQAQELKNEIFQYID